MSHVEKNQPEGTPTWIDLGIPDLDQAMDFYRALFGWEYEVGPAEAGHYTICLLDGRGVAALALNPDPRSRRSGGTCTSRRTIVIGRASGCWPRAGS